MKRTIVLLCLAMLLACASGFAAGEETALWPAFDPETGRWGYIDEAGAWGITPQYTCAGDFYGDCAMVSMGEEDEPCDGVIDTTGAFVLPPEYYVFDGFTQDAFFVMDHSDESDEVEMGWFYIPDRFFTGLHWYECAAHSDGPYVSVDDGKVAGLADRATGEIVLPMEYTVTGLYEGMAEDGFIVAERADTGECELIEIGVGPVALPEGAVIDYYEGVSEGLIPFEMDGQYGYLNTAGEIVIPAQFDCYEDVDEGLIPFEMDGQYGYLNTAGEIVIPAQYRYAVHFMDGYAEVGLWEAEDTAAVIDRAGNVMLTIPTDRWEGGYCGMVGDALWIEYANDEWGLVRPDGTELCRFSEPEAWLVWLYAPTEDGPVWVLEDLGDGYYAWRLLSREDWTLSAPIGRDTWVEEAPADPHPVEVAPGVWDYVDAYGEPVIRGMAAELAFGFDGALAHVWFTDGGAGWIDRTGREVYRWSERPE